MMIRRHSIRFGITVNSAIAAAAVFAACVDSVLFAAQKSPTGPETDNAHARDEQMRELVAGITVRELSDGPARTGELLDQPLVRYSDQQRRFPDATLWGWQLDGRPIAVSKVERVISGADGNLGWQYCLVSLSEGLIDARWGGRAPWHATKPGLTWHVFPDAPSPHGSAGGRLVQMKGLARQFDAVIVNLMLDDREQMRLLPTPIMRYSSRAQNITDGAVFSFTSKGTNPDALLLVELEGSQDAAEWRYAVVGMTGDAVTVELKGQSVWSKEATASPGDHGHWIWLVDWDPVGESRPK